MASFNEKKYQPAYSTMKVQCTPAILTALSLGHQEVVGHATHYFMHGYFPFTREHVVRASRPRPKKTKKTKIFLPILEEGDWTELEFFGPYERRVVCDIIATTMTTANRRKLRDRIHEIFSLHRDGEHLHLEKAHQSISYGAIDALLAGRPNFCNGEYEVDLRFSNLLREGIEPNPGPSIYIQIPAAIVAFFIGRSIGNWIYRQICERAHDVQLELLRQGIEANPGPDRETEVLMAKMNGLFLQQTYMCALNELSLKHHANLKIALTRDITTPDHLPKFNCAITCSFLRAGCTTSYAANARESTKTFARETAAQRCLEFIVADEEDYLSVFSCSHWIRDLLRENVESNPGPLLSTLRKRYNDPSLRCLDSPMFQMKFLDNISSVATSAGEFKNLSQTFAQLAQTVDTLLPMMTTNFTCTAQNTTDALVQIKDDLIKFGLIFVLIQGLFLVGARKTAICASLLALGFVLKFDVVLMGYIEELTKKVETPVFQMNFDSEEILYSEHFSSIGKIIFGAMAFLCIKKIPGKQDWDSYIVRLAKVPQAIEGSSKIWTMCSEYFQLALDNVKMMVLGKDASNFSVTSAYVQEIHEWMSEVQVCSDLVERKRVVQDSEFALRVSRLWPRGQIYLKDTTIPNKLSRAIQNMMFPAFNLYKFCEVAPTAGAGPKMRPACVWLIGDSQIGKSTVIWALCADMLHKMGYKNLDHLLYARQAETEFWDGYFGQPIVIYDDAFTLKDDKSKPNPEVHEVLRAQNNFPQHVHMAALSDKNTYLKAELMVYTSNQANVELASITNPEAFYNRMNDNPFKVILKPQYATVTGGNGTPEVQQLNLASLGEKGISTDIYLFQRRKFVNNKWIDLGEPIEYEVLRSVVLNDWLNKKDIFRDMMIWIRHRMTQTWEPVAIPTFQMWFSNLLKEEEESIEDVEEVLEEVIDSHDFVKSKIEELRSQGTNGMDIAGYFATSDELWDKYKNYQNSNLNASNKFTVLMKESLETCKQYMNDLSDKLKQLVSENPILSLLTLFGSAITVGAIAYSLWKSGGEDADIELAHSGSRPVAKNSQIKVELSHSGSKPIAKVKHADVQFCQRKLQESHMEVVYQANIQGCSDPNAHDIISGKVRKNCFRMEVCEGMYGNVTFIKGKIFIMPYHYLVMMVAAGIKPETIIYLHQDENEKMMSFPFSHLVKVEGKNFSLTENVIQCVKPNGDECDAVFVNLHHLQSYPMSDISNLFITRAQQNLLSSGSFSGAILTYASDKERFWRSFKWFSNIVCVDESLDMKYPDSLNLPKKRIRGFYRYEGMSVIGDCGTILAVYNNRLDRKLIGMHHAGMSGVGYSVPLNYELIEEHISKFSVEAQFAFVEPSCVDIAADVILPPGNFIAVGKSSIRVGQATKSVLRKSRLYGSLLEPIKRPAALSPFLHEGEIYDPLMEGLKKCGGTCPVLDNKVLKEITSVLSANMNSEFVEFEERHKYERFLSYKEAVCGAEDDFMRPINRTTSAGFPWCTFPNKLPGKQSYLGKDETYDVEEPFLSEQGKQLNLAVFQLLDDCRNKILKDVVCVDTKKDELRPLNKISTRIFSACSQHFVIAFRMYYLPFCSWIMHNRHFNGVAVGVNPFDQEWHTLATFLKTKGPKVIAGDFSNFDGSLNSQILWSIFHDIFIPWIKFMHGTLSDDDYNICFGLWSHVAHSVHIFESNVYMWTHSQPSGNPMTAILNSLYNLVVLRYAWQIIMGSTRYIGQHHFSEHVYMVAYGDDNVLNISDEIAELFNQQTITDALAKIGHIYTDEAKTGELVKYRTLNDVQFLKRSFKFNTELKRYVAPLDKAVIYEMLNWVRLSKSTLNVDDVLLTNVAVAFREIVYHGEAAYDELKTAITKNLHLFPKNRLPVVRPYFNLLLDVSLGFDIEEMSFF